MNLFFVFLLTFPIFQLGIYIDKMPALPYFVLLLFSYFMIFLLKQSRHFRLPYRDKKWTEFAQRQKGKQLTFRYHASGRLFFQLTVLLFAFTCLAGLFCIPFLSRLRYKKYQQAAHQRRYFHEDPDPERYRRFLRPLQCHRRYQ